MSTEKRLKCVQAVSFEYGRRKYNKRVVLPYEQGHMDKFRLRYKDVPSNDLTKKNVAINPKGANWKIEQERSKINREKWTDTICIGLISYNPDKHKMELIPDNESERERERE